MDTSTALQSSPSADGGDFIGREFEHGRGVEQAAVEVADAFQQEIAAGGHGAEQVADVAGELFWVAARARHQPGEQAAFQQTHVFRKQAENDADEKVRDGLRIQAPLAHGLGDFGEMAAGLLGDGFTGNAGSEFVRRVKYGVEDFEAARLVERRQGDVVGPGGRVVEVGVDADDVHVAHDQQRRVVEVGAVFEQLVISGVEVFVPAFVFPAKEVLFPNVGPAVAAAVFGRAFLEGERVACGISLGGFGGGRPVRKDRGNAVERRSAPSGQPCSTWR